MAPTLPLPLRVLASAAALACTASVGLAARLPKPAAVRRPRLNRPEAQRLEPRRGREMAAEEAYEREYYYWYERSLPGGVFPVGAELRARQEAMAHRERHRRTRSTSVGSPFTSTLAGLPWSELGDTPLPAVFGTGIVGGRCTCLLIQKSQNRIFAGSASGGIWKRSLDPSDRWRAVSDSAPNLSIGALAADPSQPDVLYAGTGENGISIDSFTGAGLLKSADGGEHWSPVDAGAFAGRKISQIWVDPASSARLLVSVLHSGLYETRNGGASWKKLVAAGAMGFLVAPNDSRRILLSNSSPYGTAGGGLLLSTNGGTSFTAARGPWAGRFMVGRIDLAAAPSNPSVIWAAVAEPVQSAAGFRMFAGGVFRSTDGGQSFTKVFPLLRATFTGEVQGWYGEPIAVDPADPTTVFLGSVVLYRGKVGQSLKPLTTTFTDPSVPLPYVHADFHDLRFDPGDPQTLYVACDGGVYVTHDRGATFTDLNAGLNCLQYYTGAVARNEGLRSLTGGMQDNATSMRLLGGQLAAAFGGDGFQCAVDAQNPQRIYGSYQYSSYGISEDGGDSFDYLQEVPGAGPASAPFHSPLTVDPNDGARLFVGTTGVLSGSVANGASSLSWRGISPLPLFKNSIFIRRIAVAPSDASVIYASGDGQLARTTQGGGTWKKTTPPGGQFITGVAVHPTNPNDVVVSRSGYLGGHVLRSEDGGATWTDVTADLPNTPANNVAWRLHNGRLDTFLATDTGVYYADLNASPIQWAPVGQGLPNVTVYDVLLPDLGDGVIAVTHGRGMWTLRWGPADLRARAAANDSIALSWTDTLVGESGFQIERKPAGGEFAMVGIAPQDATTFTDGGREPGVAYTYRVRALAPLGATPYSNEATLAAGQSAPGALSGLKATVVSESQIDLSWTDPGDETEIVIERKTGSNAFSPMASAPANTTRFSDTGLAAGATYRYRVTARNGGGSSAGAEVSATTARGKLSVPAQVELGTVKRGGSATKSFTIKNVSATESLRVTIAPVDDVGYPVAITSGDGTFVLPPKGSRKVTVHLSGTAQTPRTGAPLLLTSSDPAKKKVKVVLAYTIQ